MNIKLTMRPSFSTHNGLGMADEIATQYRVNNMPSGEDVRIQDFGHNGWRIRKIKDRGRNIGDWTGEYKTANEALKALEPEVNAATIVG